MIYIQCYPSHFYTDLYTIVSFLIHFYTDLYIILYFLIHFYTDLYTIFLLNTSLHQLLQLYPSLYTFILSSIPLHILLHPYTHVHFNVLLYIPIDIHTFIHPYASPYLIPFYINSYITTSFKSMYQFSFTPLQLKYIPIYPYIFCILQSTSNLINIRTGNSISYKAMGARFAYKRIDDINAPHCWETFSRN